MIHLNGYKYPILTAMGCAAILSFWQWGLNSPVLTYGEAKKTYFSPAKASPGDKINLCFDDITWYKLCPSQLTTYLQPPKIHRRDFPVYNIATPMAIGKVPPKCRSFIVPDVLDDKIEGYGMAEFSGHATHFCLITNTTALPKIKLEIVKRIIPTAVDNLSSSTK